MHRIINLFADEEGATAMEYAFIASLISIVIVGALGIAGGNLVGIFGNVSAGLAR